MGHFAEQTKALYASTQQHHQQQEQQQNFEKSQKIFLD